jgi:hypothetical protein
VRSTMQLLLIERSRAPVSLIRACPWACEVNSNSYWSDQAGRRIVTAKNSAIVWKKFTPFLWTANTCRLMPKEKSRLPAQTADLTRELEAPLARACVAKTESCLINLNVDFTTASGRSQRLVGSFAARRSAP